MCRCEYIPLRFCQGSLLLSFLNRDTLKHGLLCILTPSVFCIVCVCGVFQKAGKGGSYLSASFMCFPLNRFPLCRLCVCVFMCVCVWEGVWAFSWHRSYSPLHSTSLHPFPLLHLFSLIYPSILFRPSVAAAPLSLSITPAVMRLNLSVSTGYAHARTLNTHTPFRALQHKHTHTHNHPLKRAHYSLSHMH